MYQSLVEFLNLILKNIIEPINKALSSTEFFSASYKGLSYLFYHVLNIFRDNPITFDEFTSMFNYNDFKQVLSLFIGIIFIIICLKLIIRVFKVSINAFSYLLNGKEATDEKYNIESFEHISMDSAKNKKTFSKKRRNKNR